MEYCKIFYSILKLLISKDELTLKRFSVLIFCHSCVSKFSSVLHNEKLFCRCVCLSFLLRAAKVRLPVM